MVDAASVLFPSSATAGSRVAAVVVGPFEVGDWVSAVALGEEVVSSVLGVFATVDVVAVVGSVVGPEVGEFSAVDVGVVEGV